jgi:hypothetical protein
MDLLEDQPVAIRASLRKVSDDQTGETKYRLDFDLENKYTRIFLLKETGKFGRNQAIVTTLAKNL